MLSHFKRKSTKIIIIILLCIISLFCLNTIAYSAFSLTMNIKGIAKSRIETDIRITNFSLNEIVNATSKYEVFNKDSIQSEINLSSESQITYNIEITNYGNNNIGIYSINGLPNNLNYSIENYKLKDMICDDTGKCSSYASKVLKLTITTDNTNYSGIINLQFDFRPMYSITYKNIEGSYPTHIIKGDSIEIDMSSNPPLYILVNGSKNIDYIYDNNKLKLSNIECNIEVEGILPEYQYNYLGTVQEFVTPFTGTYKVELWGASGGYLTTSEFMGKGGYVSGNISLNKDTILYVYVGGMGIAKSEKNTSEDLGGYNGGGSCITSCSGGGGATDIRLVSGDWNNSDGLKSRIMVAAGGGGENNHATSGNRYSGSGGGLIGEESKSRSSDDVIIKGGTQTAGGKTIKKTGLGNLGIDGGFGYGGYAGLYGGGAGSGYYGGGGGLNQPINSSGTNGGEINGSGGSSFISGHDGCNAKNSSGTHTGQSIHYSNYKFTDTKMIDGAGYNWTTSKGEKIGMPTHDGNGTMTGNIGNGYAKITLLELT